MPSEKQQLPSTTSDQILPLHFWDAYFHTVGLLNLCRYEEVLDADKLHTALVRLIEREGWRKLGGRLRRNKKGKLEIHVPARFDGKSRPAVTYTHERFDSSIADHPWASQLPKASNTEKLGVKYCCDGFIDYMVRPKDPQTIDDYLRGDTPMLTLHIVNFTDATLVQLNWPHCLFDANGAKAVYNAWSLMLQGLDDRVPPAYGYDKDPLETVGTNSNTAPYVYLDKKLELWKAVFFAVRCIFDKIVSRPRQESRVLCVPAADLQALHKEALAHISVEDTGAEDMSNRGTPFISDGDLVSAWWATYAARSYDVAPKTPVTFQNVLGLRRMLADDLLPKDTAYIGNALSYLPTFYTVHEMLNKPLGSVAAGMRKTIVEAGTRQQIEARAVFDRAAINKTANPAIYGSPWMQLMVCTNWCQSQLYDCDFSAAVVRDGEAVDVEKEAASGRVGKPSWIQPHALLPPTLFNSHVSTFVIIGKDVFGNYWLQANLTKKQWAKIERVLP